MERLRFDIHLSIKDNLIWNTVEGKLFDLRKYLLCCLYFVTYLICLVDDTLGHDGLDDFNYCCHLHVEAELNDDFVLHVDEFFEIKWTLQKISQIVDHRVLHLKIF